MLNAIWICFFLASFAIALFKLLFLGDTQIFTQLMLALFSQAKTAFEIALNLSGVLALWLGMLRIGEQSGFMALLTRGLTPLFVRLMPEIPQNHPALAAIVMNISANMLGLDNAATPLGIQAMRELQTLNPHPETISNAQVLFLVINTASVTLFPVTIFTYRAQFGAANPMDVFIPLLISSYIATLVGVLTVAIIQKINLCDKIIAAYFVGFTGLLGGLIAYFAQLSQAQMLAQSALISNVALFSIVCAFIAFAAYKKVNVYEAFIAGAQEGFSTAVTIVPYLVAMLVAIGVFRASGGLEILISGLRYLVELLHYDSRFVDALPTAMMKSLSGSGARGMMLDILKTYGADSFVGRLVSIVQGSSETTFYVIAVYCGAVGIKNIRQTAVCGLIADFASILTAIIMAYWFFG